ncbi:hypothetical protein [Microbulbifer magnicolonia]|uniref:hypothetical protein n=1 Tax=Microbulbifer magnicolonia TaxID=3109744 RepID=UPI002B40BBA5|nr:hypothetical protein [Microbulbifer sp. GG15]
MYRKDLIDILFNHPQSVRDLSALMEEPIKDMVSDLQHLQKSLRHSPYDLEITPAKCKHCGFGFSRSHMTRPGRCPKCRSTWIDPPLIGVTEKH